MCSETAHREKTWRPSAEAPPPPNLEQVVWACLGRLLFAEPDVEPLGAEQHYLFRQYRAVRHLADPAAALARCLAEPVPADAPLARLAAEQGLTPGEVLSVALALLVEEEPMMGRLLAHLQNPVGGSRPTLGLLTAALAPLGDWRPGDLLAGAAVANDVLRVLDEGAPLPERVVAVPLGLALALRGRPPLGSGVHVGLPGEPVPLPPSVRGEACRRAEALGDDGPSLLVLRCATPAEARSVAAEVAACLGAEPLFIDEGADLAGLGPACRVAGLLPVFEHLAGGAKTVEAPALRGHRGPCLLLTGPDAQVGGEGGTALHWSLGPPSREERRQLWRTQLGDAALSDELADGHIHSAGRIAELARLARREAGLRGEARPNLQDLRRAAWQGEGSQLGSLAQPLATEIPDEALVLAPPLAEELRQLLARCRLREGLDRSLGVTIRARYQSGVRCLLVGPSGTGKTLAAGWLASRLGLPLYRVDLASVVSKYIGETEKNLAELLARAEHSEIVLLFDEADSLFGKRTDIKDSNDRFANSQTNYLLQRIESYRGIVLLTSNSRERFDSAFTRRLDRIVEFPLPGPQERRALWQAHLGEGHDLDLAQINQLAAACDLAGGHIRNAVLGAAVAAASEGRRIALADVLWGLADEYRKLGRQFPAQLRRAAGG